MTRSTRRRARGRAFLTTIDALTLVAIAILVGLVALPRARVRRLLRNEDDVVVELETLERLEEAHRASGATDADRDGKGEYAPLSEVLGPHAVEFERIEGTDFWRRGGYYYTALLPDRDKKPVSALSPDVYTDYAEVAELLVAWPAEPGTTGMRAYARWPGGQLLQHAIDGYPYTRDHPPVPGDVLIAVTGGRPRAADRYEREDWRPPQFVAGKRAAK